MGKKAKVVFDTNIWVSLFLKMVVSDDYIKAKQHLIVYTSEDILLEISKVLLYPKIAEILQKANVSPKEVLRAIEVNSIVIKTHLKFYVIEEDPEDNKILECAVASGAGFIVTGDKHLLKLGVFKGIKIFTAREFFDSINS